MADPYWVRSSLNTTCPHLRSSYWENRGFSADGGWCWSYQVYLLALDWRSTALSYRYPGSSFPCFDLGNAKEVVNLIARVKILLQELDTCWVILRDEKGRGRQCLVSRWTGNFEERKKIGIIPDNQYILQTLLSRQLAHVSCLVVVSRGWALKFELKNLGLMKIPPKWLKVMLWNKK